MRKSVNEFALTGQVFVKDGDLTIEKLLKNAKASVKAFERFEVGAGIEKKQDDFVAEVMAQVRQRTDDEDRPAGNQALADPKTPPLAGFSLWQSAHAPIRRNGQGEWQMTAPYKRILVKLSGEALLGTTEFGIDPAGAQAHRERGARDPEERRAGGLRDRRRQHLPRRGPRARRHGSRHRRSHGHAGDRDERARDAGRHREPGRRARVQSAVRINQVCEDYIRRRAMRHLEKGRIVIFAAGTGNPFFTTDSAAALRAIEIDADVLLKATKVNGIYDSDPMKNPDAKRYATLTYDKVLADRLNVMDATAIVMCRDNRMPLQVFNLNNAGDLPRVVRGEDIGTVVTSD